jgi:deoxyribonuclease IV
LSLNNTSQLGFHLRLQQELIDLLRVADTLSLPAVQFFLAKTENKQTTYITPTAEEKALLQKIITQNKATISIHASYWINAASGKDEAYTASKRLLKKELTLARDLEAHFLVMHPGTANGFDPDLPASTVKQLGIERLATLLNEVLKHQSDITILLENTAHGRNAVGSDLNDYRRIKELLDEPEKVYFCLDTAHAFAYGYNIKDFDAFLDILKASIGLDELKLIHLNDIEGEAGAKQDKHMIPGQGRLGMGLLQKIAYLRDFQDIPKIIELPSSPPEIILDVITRFISEKQ